MGKTSTLIYEDEFNKTIKKIEKNKFYSRWEEEHSSGFVICPLDNYNGYEFMLNKIFIPDINDSSKVIKIYEITGEGYHFENKKDFNSFSRRINKEEDIENIAFKNTYGRFDNSKKEYFIVLLLLKKILFELLKNKQIEKVTETINEIFGFLNYRNIILEEKFFKTSNFNLFEEIKNNTCKKELIKFTILGLNFNLQELKNDFDKFEEINFNEEGLFFEDGNIQGSLSSYMKNLNIKENKVLKEIFLKATNSIKDNNLINEIIDLNIKDIELKNRKRISNSIKL